MQPRIILAICLLFGGTALGQGRYTPQGAAQRYFQEGERAQAQGDELREAKETEGANKRYAAAAEAFHEAIGADPAYVDAYVRLGLVYYSLGQYDKPLELLEQASQREPNNFDLLFWYGQNLLRAGKVEKGLKRLERVAAETDRFPEVYVVLGNHYYKQKQFSRAKPAYERYLQLKPDATAARAKLGNTYFKQKQYDEALAAFEQVRLVWTDNVQVLTNIGNAHFSLGNYPKAVETLKIALKKDPERVSTVFNLAQSLFKLERHEEALRYYQQFQRARPKSFNGHYFAGSSLMALGRNEDALKSLSTAQSLKPKIAQPLYKMGVIHLRSGNPDAAEKQLLAARAIKDDPWVVSGLGTVARQRKNYDEAGKLHARAVAMDGTKARLHANLALTQYRAGKLAEALKALDAALKLDAKDAWIRSLAGTLYAAQAKGAEPVEAMKLTEAALRMRPKDPKLLANRSLLRVAAGDAPGATADAEAALAIDPKLASARYAQGRALLASGDSAAASDTFRAAYELAPSAGAAASQGAALLSLGKVEGAVELLDAARRSHPESKTLRQNRALAHYRRAAARVNKGVSSGRDANDLKVALANSAQLGRLVAARAHYAALVVALRRGDGTSARQHLAKAQSLASKARKAKQGRMLTRRASPQHLEYLTAYTNTLIRRFDRAAQLLEPLRAARNARNPEGKLRRHVLQLVGEAALKAGELGKAQRAFSTAQILSKAPQTDLNLAVISWGRAKQARQRKRIEARFKVLRKKVPEAIYNHAVALEARGAHEEAWAAYKKYAAQGGPKSGKAAEIAEAKARIFGFGGE